jgi:hypothetical protein
MVLFYYEISHIPSHIGTHIETLPTFEPLQCTDIISNKFFCVQGLFRMTGWMLTKCSYRLCYGISVRMVFHTVFRTCVTKYTVI